MKTASGNKQETVVLLTWRKNKLLIYPNIDIVIISSDCVSQRHHKGTEAT